MIGLVKLCLRKVLGHAVISPDELASLLAKNEAVVNDRPISYSSDDSNDISPLTPSMLLYCYRLTNIPDLYIDPSLPTDPSLYERPILTKRESLCLELKRHFWGVWQREYLVALRERDRNLAGGKLPDVQVGSIVLLYDEGLRSLWELGRVLSLKQGLDGIVRSVTLRMTEGITTTRPSVKLSPLALISEDKCVDNSVLTKSTRSVTPRDAAVKVK